MASMRNDASASGDFLSSENPFADFSTDIDQLSEELSMQQGVLASLLDLPESSAREKDIATVKADIANIKRQLSEARSKGSRSTDSPAAVAASAAYARAPGRSTNMSMDNRDRVDRVADQRRTHGTTTPSSDSMVSIPEAGRSTGSGLPQRKRSLGSSHLDADSSRWGVSKSRRTSPSPGLAGFSSAFGGFEDDGFQDGVIDLTGDDDTEWRSTIQRQKEAMKQAGRRKAEEDRDAALARQLNGRPSPPINGSTFGSPSSLGQNNAFNRILGRPSQTSSGPFGQTDHIKREPGLALATRPHASVKTEPAPLPRDSSHAHRSVPSTVKPEPSDSRYRMPGSFVDSDDENEAFGPPKPLPGGFPRNPRPSAPSSYPSYPSYASTAAMPTPPLTSQNSTHGSGASGFHRQNSNVPAIELARQSSMSRQEASRAWPPVGPIGQQLYPPNRTLGATSNIIPSSQALLGTNRPGYMQNGTYYPPSGPPIQNRSLAETISRVNRYDFHAMTDGDGNLLSPHLASYLDDYVNDPRKTEEDIKQLLSNIRPDMDVPEEERGETPEAMKYPLYVHQQLALKWMIDTEDGTNKGGILADDMGLGKTISTLALMVSRPAPDNIKTNLIIGPVALVKQWESEVKKKLKGTHKLSVFLLHSKKKPYSEIRNYDVVLTTYGLLAAEWKRYNTHVKQRQEAARYRAEDDMELAKKCPLLHPRSKFYRIILDEAQCIKNKDTQGSQAVHHIKATYRWCLTGTPMMNSVSELYPLIRFLKIRPYSDFTTFQRAFKSLNPKSHSSDYNRDNAMRKLQTVLKAMMLRRMKDSMIDGKPILSLPPKTENSEHVVFSDDEQQFYQDLETRSQVVFNKFLRAGTVGKNYSNILVLLLRLRQACCHPHLTDFDVAGAAASDTDMIALAKTLEGPVVERIKAIEAFECPICYDGVQDPILVIPCGHDTCTECFTSLTENNAQNNIRLGEENAAARCPVCRGPVQPTKVITLTAFRKVHAPEALEPGDDAQDDAESMSDSDDSYTDSSSTASDNDSDADSFGNLAGFVVRDDDVSDADDDIDAELDAAAQKLKKEPGEEAKEAKDAKAAKKKNKKKRSKAERKAKTKSKSEEIKPHMLKQLRAEADKNKEARRRYMHYLRENWEDSAKVTEVIRLLEQIQETDEKTIIFSQWTGLLDMIECQIKAKLSLLYCRYTGKMSRAQRDEAVNDFLENPRSKVMLVSLRAGNAGLNLTVASRIIICDPFWNPFIEAQAIDRAHRIGQQREVQVHRILVKGTVEDRILALQENKRKLVEAALDEGQSKSLGRLSERELAYLFGVGSGR